MVAIWSFYVDWNSGEGFFEDQLVGKKVKIGDTLELMVVEHDQRCKINTIYPQTAEVNFQILRHVNKQHGGCTGVCVSVLKQEMVNLGDAISILDLVSQQSDFRVQRRIKAEANNSDLFALVVSFATSCRKRTVAWSIAP